MIFSKYPSIEPAYREVFIDIVKSTLAIKNISDKFVAFEKVHGANAIFSYDGQELKIGSRNQFLIDDEIKRCWKSRLYEIIKKIKLLYNLIEQDDPNLQILTVYGERFGGFYPHKDVPKIPGMGRIQAGVYYSPNVEFYGFDIKINGKFISVEKSISYFKSVGILTQKILHSGTLDSLLKISPVFQSTIPAMLDLPPIEDNEAEGYIIRPVKEIYYGHSRIILKHKNKKFIEKRGPKKPKRHIELSDHFQEIIENLRCYVCVNRLNNVLSKLGTLTVKDFGLVMKEMIKDIKDDFEKDYPDVLSNLEKKDLKIVMNPINKELSTLIRKEWLPKV